MAATSFFGGAFFGGEFFNDAPTPTPGRSGLGGDDVPRRTTRSPHKGWDREEWKARVKDKADEIEATLRETYDRLTGKDAPISVIARVDEIVRPVSKQVEKDAPLRIDWQKISKDYERANALMRLYREEQELQAIIDDDDEVLLMVLQ